MRRPQADLTDAAFALGSVAFDTARIPLHLLGRLPGMRRIAFEGAFVRARVQSRVEGIAEQAVDRLLAGRLPEAVARAAMEHHVAERIARERAAVVDLELV